DPSELYSLDLDKIAKDEQEKSQTLTCKEIANREWEVINAHPKAEMFFLDANERNRDPVDSYFAEAIDKKFLAKWNIYDQVPARSKLMLQRFLLKYADVYAFKGEPLGRVTAWYHQIPTGDNPPVKQHPYRLSELQKSEVEKQVDEMLRQGVIVPAV